MNYKMVNILGLLVLCVYVSAQVPGRPAGPPAGRPAGRPAVPSAGPPADESEDDPLRTLSLSSRPECSSVTIQINGMRAEIYTNESVANASSIDRQEDPEDVEDFSNITESGASTLSRSVAAIHVGYIWRNLCNSVRKFAPINRAITINGVSVTVIYPQKFYQVTCGKPDHCRCYGRCIQEYSYQWALVARGCRYYWALIRVPCGCSCHRYFPYYYQLLQADVSHSMRG